MVHADEVPPDELPVITKQVATRLRRLAGKKVVPSNARITLGDSFQVWTLPAEKIASISPRSSPDLGKLGNWNNRWYHIIKVNRRAVAFFRSTTKRAEYSLFYQPKVARIEKFLKDQKKAGKNLKIRLLRVADYHMVALWTIDEDSQANQLLVIDAPANFNLGGQILTAMEFLKALRSQQPITGIRSGSEPSLHSKRSR